MCIYSMHGYSLSPISTKIGMHTRHVKRKVFAKKLNRGSSSRGWLFYSERFALFLNCHKINEHSFSIDSFA